MGLFNFFKINALDDDYILFSRWFNSIKKLEIPDDIVAINFNLYEGSNNTYDIQLVGTNEFDENDEDWACTNYFTTGENIFFIKRKYEIKKWQQGLAYIKKIIKKYLNENNIKDTFKKIKVIGLGFVDGDIEIISRPK
jgi:hypothetical protein